MSTVLEKPHMCGTCGRTFKLKMHLVLHMKQTHEGMRWDTHPKVKIKPRRTLSAAQKARISATQKARVREIDARRRMPGGGINLEEVTVPMMPVTLTTRHEINGVRYGPGQMVVTEEIGRTLMEQETRVRQAEADFRAERAFIWDMNRGRAVPVPYHFFNEAFGNPHPALVGYARG